MANIDYDEKLTQVENEKQQALTDVEQTYGGMINEAQKFYQDQIDASKEWASTQQNLQQAQTDFTIDQIEQQKNQTQKDYTKEQSGAYADWQKESNQYGANAEQMAAAGLSGSGYSESSQVSMYNTYQNRVATARASFNQAVQNYNNAIKEAQLQNSSALAEIAYTALQQQIELSLQGFQYENQLILDLEGRKAQIEDTYHGRYLDVLNQMNAERAFEEQVRQYENDVAFREKQYEEGVRQYEQDYAENKRRYDQEYAEGVRQYENDVAFREKQYTEGVRQYHQDAAFREKQYAEEKRQFEREMKRLEEMDAEEKRQFDIMYNGKSADEVRIEKASELADSGLQSANSIMGVVKNLLTGKGAAEDKSVGSNYSEASYQKKLANDEKKLHGEEQTKKSATNTTMQMTAPTVTSGITLGGNLGRTIVENIVAKNTYEVATDYYRGTLNPDAKTYGTFSNGYQPKGINGHGKLEKTGETELIPTVIQYGTKKGKSVKVKQNVWKAEDGTRWIWDGMNNCYVSAD